MRAFLLNIFLALAWVALSAQLTTLNFVIGYSIAYAILWLSQDAMERSAYFEKAQQVAGFALFFAWELVKANLRVAHDVVTIRHYMRPGVVAIPLDAQTDAEITLLANLITLTPGTLSLDVSEDRRTLFVHAMYLHDVEAFKASIKTGFERRVLEVLR